ncbi:MAG: prepilin peptidase [Halobacteriales archaeon]
MASVASGPDLLRLIAIPVLGWAAWRDHRIRRVSPRLWWPLVGLGAALLVWEGSVALSHPGPAWRLFLLRSVISLGGLGLLAVGFYRYGLIGAADAKAIATLAVLFPTYPAYTLGGVLLPLVRPPLGVFSLTVLTNTALLGLLYPAWLAIRNVRERELSVPIFFARRVHWSELPTVHGRLAETPDGWALGGLDLDALRMYLRWRKASLIDLRSRPGELRDPKSLPADLGEPTDGRPDPTAAISPEDVSDVSEPVPGCGSDESDATAADPWGAEAFLSSVDSAYGATPQQLRAGLEFLSRADRVWITPGLPYLVPVFLGLLVAFGYGDLLYGGFRAAGLV